MKTSRQKLNPTTKVAIASIVLFGSLTLAACGTSDENRAATGAGLGAAGGYLLGAPVAGALAGGAGGVFTNPDDLNLGEPVWEDW